MSVDNPTNLIAFGPSANCTLALCPLEYSILQYRPSIAANATFIAIFGILLAIQLFQGVVYKTWGYTASVSAGSILQIIGYVGRIMLHSNPFAYNPFMIQIICITIAPIFYCAAIYVLLSKFIITTDITISRFNPRLFYWVFIPADITCLVLQATGGALSVTAYTAHDVNIGVNVTKAGLILQVVLLVSFLALFCDYLYALRRKGQTQMARNVRVFLIFLASTVVFILVRCIYRIVELKDGYFGPNFRKEPDFIALEGAVMCVAVVCLIIAHPGPIFAQKSKQTAQETATLR